MIYQDERRVGQVEEKTGNAKGAYGDKLQKGPVAQEGPVSSKKSGEVDLSRPGNRMSSLRIRQGKLFTIPWMVRYLL